MFGVCLAQFSLSNVHKRGLEHHHFISEQMLPEGAVNNAGEMSFLFGILPSLILQQRKPCSYYVVTAGNKATFLFLDYSQSPKGAKVYPASRRRSNKRVGLKGQLAPHCVLWLKNSIMAYKRLSTSLGSKTLNNTSSSGLGGTKI